MMSDQLSLQVSLSDAACFENYFAAKNAEAVSAVRTFAESGQGVLYLYGNRGAGKTHLLYAAQRTACGLDRGAQYLCLSDPEISPEVLAASSGPGLRCIDDIHCAADRPGFERAILSLYERSRGAGILVAAARPPAAAGFTLPDLATRLSSGPVYRLDTLDDSGRVAALRLRAAWRGLQLSDDVLAYVLRRHDRDSRRLFDLLDRLDRESLAARRRITVPFLQRLERGGL